MGDGGALDVALLIVLVIVLVAHAALGRRGDKFTLGHTRGVRSGVDGLEYRVHLVHGDPGAAADTMAQINARVVGLLRALRARYLRAGGGAAYPARAQAARRLLNLYNPDNLAENSPRDPEGDTSYTIDKGAILALCLRERDPAHAGDPAVHDIHDINTLTFVALHELTHIAIEELDHPRRFWEAFKFLLGEAAAAGILRAVDYSAAPAEYCGLRIDYNPLYDAGLAALS